MLPSLPYAGGDDGPRARFLRTVEALADVKPRWLARLDSRLVEVHIDSDEMVFRAGEPADAIYIVRRGRVAVFSDTRGRAVRLIERASRGQILGLVGALGGSRRSASARALTPTTLLRLERYDLLHLLEQDSSLGLRFTLAVVSRHARNAAAALELGDRKEMRIRVGREVDLVVGRRHRVRATIENLSRGGICVSGALPDGLPHEPTRYVAHLVDGDQVLSFRGRVAWRQGSRIGLAFVERAPGHDLLVQGALRQLLRGPTTPTPRENQPDLPSTATARD